VQMITHHYWPATATPLIVGLNTVLIVVIVGCAYVIFAAALRQWWRALRRA